MKHAGAQLFSAANGEPARLEIPGLPVKPEAPAITELAVAHVSGGTARLEWRTNNRTMADVDVAAVGEAQRTVRQVYRTRQHRVVIADLALNTEYAATVTGTDFTGRAAAPQVVRFHTRSPAAADGEHSPGQSSNFTLSALD